MKLWDAVQLRSIQADGETGEWFETYYGMQPIPTFHPPSLKKPAHIVPDQSTDGWHPNDPPALKQRARQDLAEIMKRVRRQTGKPELTQQALYPVFPSIAKWT